MGGVISSRSSWCRAMLAGACLGVLSAGAARGQVIVTEIMFNPLNPGDRPWEWVEIQNISGAAVNLEGWVLGDRASRFEGANLVAGPADLTVPAGGVAVIYDAPQIGPDPQRFYDAWGGGIALIPVTEWRPLADGGDRIGLWDSYAAYNPAGDPPSSQPDWEPAWAGAVFEVDYGGEAFPPLSQGNGRSFAWSGAGDPADGASWIASVDGELGAYTSVETIVEGTQINSAEDRGTPGRIDSPGTPPPGSLLITEIMFDPASSIPFQNERPFEWVEILNNTGSTIDFSQTPYVLDDRTGSGLSDYNVTSGVVPDGQIAVLYGGSADLTLTVEQMKAIWEPGVGVETNFIPVSGWKALRNSQYESIGLWDDLALHQLDKETAGEDATLWTNAVAAVTYRGDGQEDWPGRNNSGSIYLNDLGGDPMSGSNWTLSGSAEDPHPAAQATAIFADAPDHVGGDVGSPGFVPGAAGLAGDFNGDGLVDAADYTAWRDGGGSITGHALWKANFGATAVGSGSLTTVPEPAAAALALSLSVMLVSLRRRWRAAHR